MKLATSLFIALSASTLCLTAIAADGKPATASTKSAKPTAATERAPQEQGRNWSAIDTNKDGLVSPEEMETWLKANPGPAKGK